MKLFNNRIDNTIPYFKILNYVTVIDLSMNHVFRNYDITCKMEMLIVLCMW